MATLHNLREHLGSPAAGIEVNVDLTGLVADLFEQHHRAVFAYLYRLVGDREWAHDLSQETFMRLFRTRQRLPQVENRRAWIYRIATNIAFNALKRRRRFTWLPWRQSDTRHLTAPDPLDLAGQRLVVEHALTQLLPHYRAPLLLHSHYGLSVREISEALGISQAAVKTRLYRAREMFRQAYERDNDI